MKEILEKNESLKPAKKGDIIKGVIVEKGRSSVFLDLGARGTGIIYGKEFIEAKNELKGLKTGEVVSAKIIELENEQGYVELSSSSASKETAWETLKEKQGKGEIISIKISGANKGGLIAEISGIQGFLPVSQLSYEHYPRVENADKQKILSALQEFVGKEIKVKIFDIDKEKEKLILSEKAKERDKLKRVLENYKVGDKVQGKITAVSDFGAFMKFSAVKKDAEQEPTELEGLIHISELDWSIVKNPGDIVSVGQTIKAQIIDISNGRISLSLKALRKDPWQDIEKKYKKGDVIKGKATKFNPFGAFVQVDPKIQGLCHISEFGTKAKMEKTIELNKEYEFQILAMEPKEHRMSLKLIKN